MKPWPVKPKTLTLFFIVALGELLAIAMGLEGLQLVCKPLIMPALGAYYFAASKEGGHLARPVVAAIVFSWIGDVCLMFQDNNEMYFVAGLGAFLIAQLCYIKAYSLHAQKKEGTARGAKIQVFIARGAGRHRPGDHPLSPPGGI